MKWLLGIAAIFTIGAWLVSPGGQQFRAKVLTTTDNSVQFMPR